MKLRTDNHSRILAMGDLPHNLVVGVGSSHGDDAVGFHLLELIQAASMPGVQFEKAQDPLEIATYLDDCRSLWVIDACRSGQTLGTVTRLEWPIDRFQWPACSSSHALGLVDALQLAEKLGKLPNSTVIYGIEIGEQTEPSAVMSSTLSKRVPEIANELLHDLRSSLGKEVLPGEGSH